MQAEYSPAAIGATPQRFLLAASHDVPNHPTWPLLIYAGAVPIEGADPAAAFESLFARNHWPPAWRNGVYGYPHFHTTAHEVLGIYSGEVTVRFGGESGVVLTAVAGDVIVLPAGTGHQRVAARGSLGVVGGYPRGQSADLCRPDVAQLASRARAAGAVPHPGCDPVQGDRGALMRFWV